jgi:hypothetical protein
MSNSVKKGVKRVLQWLALAFVLTSVPAFSADISHGASIFSGVCSACHSDNPLNNVYYVMNGANNPGLIEEFIADTYPMQPLSYLTTSDIDDVAAYLGSLTGSVTIAPQAGYWWNPAEGGRGFTLEQNAASGNVFFATYLYSASGEALWYAAGPAPMTGTTFSAPLLAYAGGQTLTGAYQPSMQGASPGNVSISFSDTTHASLTWPGGTIPIQRYEFTPGGLTSPPTGNQPQTGYWWNPAEGGRGYTVEVQNNIAFVAAYMYDGSGNPVWYASGPAALIGNNVYQGSWTLYSGGETLTGPYQSPNAPTAVGSLTIQFATATSGTLTLPDGRQIPIQRFSF